MHQFHDYLHQNWRADPKNALKQYNQAAVAVIKPNRYLAFLGHPADMIFVQDFTQPDFQATPQKCVICDIFLAN